MSIELIAKVRNTGSLALPLTFPLLVNGANPYTTQLSIYPFSFIKTDRGFDYQHKHVVFLPNCELI